MPIEGRSWRGPLARTLSQRARMSPREAMATEITFSGPARRVGISGPPGAGKSSLIARLALHWLEQGERVAVLAIDPTSPLTGGALLGDRIRMDEAAANPNIYIRSLSSGDSGDGLCANICMLLDAVDHAGFNRVVLETVGVGQVSHDLRMLVETFALVLVPESGDTIQAMKAGILEVADIYVVNKADLPSADNLATELRSIAEWRSKGGKLVPPVLLASAAQGRGVADLAAAIDAHRDKTFDSERATQLIAGRRDYHIRSVLTRHLEQVIDARQAEMRHAALGHDFRLVLDELAKIADN